MPSLEQIRQFNQRLVRLGNEPMVVADWGEDLEEVEAPEAGLDSDITSLLSGSEATETEAAAPEARPDFAELLGDESAGEELPSADDLAEPVELSEPPEPVATEEWETSDEWAAPSPADEELAAEDVSSTDDEFAITDEDLTASDEFALPAESGAGVLGGESFDVDESGADTVEADETDAIADLFGGEDVFTGEELGDLTEVTEETAEEIGLPEDTDVSEGSEFDAAEFDTSEFAVPEFGEEDFSTEDFSAEAPATDEFAVEGPAAETPVDTEATGMEPAEFESPDEAIAFEDTEFTFSDEDLGASLEAVEAAELEEVEEPGFEDVGAEDAFEMEPLGDVDISEEFPDVEAGVEISDDGEFEIPETVDQAADEGVGAEGSFDDIDEFSLGDFGDEFGVLDETVGETEEELNPASSVPEVAPGVPAPGAAGPAGFQISEEQFRALQSTLVGLPLNLKTEVQELISESKGTPQDVEKLIRMLIAGDSPQAIASFTGRVTGKQIRIPRGYERRSGEQFEQERKSFAYQFRENILPVARVVLLAAVGITLLALGLYHLAYRPLLARSLYRDGLEQIAEEQFTLANDTFDRAFDVWPHSTRWFYLYAEAFATERQYTLSAEKYEQLIFGMDADGRAAAFQLLDNGLYRVIANDYRPEEEGILDYANLQSEVFADYALAEQVLQIPLSVDVHDYDARLALGDNYLRWGETEPTRYEDARASYARLIERYGQTDELLFRMLRYFIRTDNLDEVIVIKDAFQADDRAAIEPDAYAELAGYLLDYSLTDEIEPILFRALDVDNTIPEIHYELARFYRVINADREENLALETAVSLLKASEPLTRTQRGMLVDSLIRQGENLYDQDRFLESQDVLTEAIDTYEDGVRRRALARDPKFARAYARLGDIYFYVGREFDSALRSYYSAEENGYQDSGMDYRQGYILYRADQVNRALEEFRQAAEDQSAVTDALLYATANTYFRRENYFAAEAYYRDLIDRVQRKRDRIETLLIDEDRAHLSIILYLIRGYNNLGVALDELYRQTADSERYSEGMYYLTLSTELSENLSREPETLTRSDAVDLAYLNIREILYPRPEYELQIYSEIPEDLGDLVF